MDIVQNNVGWFVPTGVAHKVLPLWDAYTQRSKEAATRRHQQTYADYAPWMAMEGLEDELAPLFEASNHTSSLNIDHGYLHVLANTVQKNSACPLKYFRVESEDMQIWADVPAEVIHHFEDAKKLLFSSLPDIMAVFKGIVSTIIPLKIANHLEAPISGFGSHLCPGAIFLTTPVTSRPYWRAELAIDLAHELAHQIIILYQRADSIVAGDLESPVFSGILNKDRPSIMAVHGAAALCFMCIASLAIRENPEASEADKSFAARELVSATGKLATTVSALRNDCQLTEVGSMIVNEIALVSDYCSSLCTSNRRPS
jgi:hypothetical protein